MRTASSGNTIVREVSVFAAFVFFAFAAAVVVQRASQPGEPSQTQNADRTALRQVDDSRASPSGEHFNYVGQWQHLRNFHDGRSEGTSSRTFHAGAAAYLQFSGRSLELFGVKGPTGGYADVDIDNEPPSLVLFYAPQKEAGVLVYTSPELRAGSHTVEIVVEPPPPALPERRYVNLDGAAYSPR